MLYDKHFLEIKGITFTPQAEMENVLCQTITVEIKKKRVKGEDSLLPFGERKSPLYMDISKKDMFCFLVSVVLVKSQKMLFSYQ